MDILFQFWNALDLFLKLILAVLCGGLVGLVSTSHTGSVRFSTYILICFTATLMMLIFIQLSLGLNLNIFESGTIAVLAGFAILGASIIIGQRSSMQSIFDASVILIVASIGIVIGAGYFSLAVAASIISSIILAFLYKFKSKNNEN